VELAVGGRYGEREAAGSETAVKTGRTRRAAYHEAGHAVVAWALNLPIGEMRLAKGDEGVQIGRADHLTVIEQLAICYAGLAAGDLSGDPEAAGEGTLDIRMTTKILVWANLTRGSPAFCEELRRQSGTLAETIVRRHEEMVARLAARLLVSDLSVAEVAEILDLSSRRPQTQLQ